MKLSIFQPSLGCLFIHGALSSVLPRGNDDYAGHPTLGHDKIVPLTQSASTGLEGQLELRFNPFLYVSGGCDPYPAVDATGNLGEGLRPTGGGRSGCDAGGTAQVYVRGGQSQDRTGIMFSYYMPKVRWGKGNNEGHRHYWASIVVWLNQFGCGEDASSVSPVGVSFTTDHLVWDTAPAGKISYASSGVGVDTPTHPKMQIHDNAFSPFTGADGDKVFERTAISWFSLPAAAQKALSDVKYEKTQVPFTDANFQAHLDAAYRESFYGGLTDQQGCFSQEAGSSVKEDPISDSPPKDKEPAGAPPPSGEKGPTNAQ
ncbi:NPP1 domain-containing protein [Colletotrichum simmondsii]|uniref:NPP1 domain-containing protein n=1 Tax=Colletotrichum simmondsii TaxID=703756 RepID=A0A135S6J5_9PEZI|nr:NPP1 domain-containing protein [Colletotrichum simmondsii]